MTLTLLESASLSGRFRFVELCFFEFLGELAPSVRDPSAAVYFSGASHAHAWRAELWARRLPVSSGLPGSVELTVGGPVIGEVLELLATAESPGDTLGAFIMAIYPAMLTGYRRRLALAEEAPDGPVVRVVRRAIADLGQITEEGAAILRSRGPDEGVLTGRVAGALARPGGIFGPPCRSGS
jgi:hypothetical protein